MPEIYSYFLYLFHGFFQYSLLLSDPYTTTLPIRLNGSPCFFCIFWFVKPLSKFVKPFKNETLKFQNPKFHKNPQKNSATLNYSKLYFINFKTNFYDILNYNLWYDRIYHKKTINYNFKL